MKKTALLLGFLGCFGAFQISAQKSSKNVPAKKPVAVEVQKPNPAIFTIGSEVVNQDEFLRQLNKNRKDKGKPTEAEISEYLDLYINFKLKVKEAMTLQLDTNPAFISELAGYRKQLATPYLNDKKVTEGLMQEAYERMKAEVNASHILINVAPNASPKDTLAAYTKVLDLRKRALKGESFDSLASKYSDDPSAKKNFGKLGWFTVFQMVYPFENMAYTTPKGDISVPFRTQFGYHIMRVNNNRPARGEVKAQHIMIRTGYGASTETMNNAKERIDAAYSESLKGVPFDSLVERYSQDDGSKGNNGVMNWMASLSGYPDEFKDVCFGLKKDETSKPFATEYGWHMVKYVDYRALGDYKEVQDVIKNKVTRDSRSEGSKTAVIVRVKKENSYKENTVNINEFTAKMDSSFLKGAWKYDEKKMGDKTLFTVGTMSYSAKEFGSYLEMNQEPHEKENAAMIAKNQFTAWANDKCLAYEESILETKYPEFNNIMTEYHDGILLFDLTDRKVWSKAINDTAGLESFHAGSKSKYMWKERVNYQTYNCMDAKTKATAVKMFNSGKKDAEVFKKLCKKIPNAVVAKDHKAEKTDATAAKLWDKKGVVDIIEPDVNRFYYVLGVMPPEPKSLKEAKGLVTSDYQEYLMEAWVKELRAKYPIVVNEPELLNLTK
ncbi:MAG: peptidylprolyl isomerase [bacterium]|nr:peptidylprolyl isomerase [bacterium]